MINGLLDDNEVQPRRSTDTLEERVLALEEWKHRIEVHSAQKLVEVEVHRAKIDQAIELIAKTQASMVKEIQKIDGIITQIRTAALSIFITSALLIGVFTLGPVDFLRSVLSR